MKKDPKREWTTEITEDFENLKKEVTEAPCLAHFDRMKDNYVTTVACIHGYIVKKTQLMNWNCQALCGG